MSRAQLTSTVEQNSAGALSPYVAAKNFVANGGMDYWQRGTSFSTPSTGAYTADRFSMLNTNTGTTATTVSRQATGDTTNLPNIQYCLRYQRNSGSTGTAVLYATQSLESASSIPLVGRTVTFSFYARKGANFSAASSILSGELDSGTGTDQNINSGFTGSTTVAAISATLTTTWQRFTFTGTVPSSATQLGFYFYYTPTGTAGANDYFEVTGVQLEQGSVATPFARAGGTLQGELALCQRYFEKSYDQGTAIGASTAYGRVAGTGNAAAGTAGYLTAHFRYKVSKRVSPTFTAYDMVGASGKVTRTVIATADYNGNGYLVEGQGADGITILSSSGTAANLISFHFTADAEL